MNNHKRMSTGNMRCNVWLKNQEFGHGGGGGWWNGNGKNDQKFSNMLRNSFKTLNSKQTANGMSCPQCFDFQCIISQIKKFSTSDPMQS